MNITMHTTLCEGSNLRKMILPPEFTGSLCRNCLRGCVSVESSADTHLTVDPLWAGMGWAWHFHQPSGDVCCPVATAAWICLLREDRASCPAWKEERPQRRADGVEHQDSWGVLLLGRGRKACLGKASGGFFITHFWINSMAPTTSQSQVCHRPNSLPSLGTGAHEAVLPGLVGILALVTGAWQLG